MLSPEDQASALDAPSGWRQRCHSPLLTWDDNLSASTPEWAAPRGDFTIQGKRGDDDAI